MANRKVRWFPVKGFEGIYEISETGRVRSLSRSVMVCRNGIKYLMRVSGRKIKVRMHEGKYPAVTMCKDGKMSLHYINHLLIENIG